MKMYVFAITSLGLFLGLHTAIADAVSDQLLSNQYQENIFNGFLIFFLSMIFVIWFYRRGKQ